MTRHPRRVAPPSSMPPVVLNSAELAETAAREVAQLRRDQRDSMRLIAVLIRKLGGTARVTSDDLLKAADGTLTRMDCDDGFVLTMTRKDRQAG